jgi:IclR family pca regulon transcriptional regulator
METKADHVRALERGLAVINAFSAEHQRLTLSEVARRTGLTRATARRLLHTLVNLGYVEQQNTYFVLLPKVLDLGYSYLSALRLPDLAIPVMEELVVSIRESSSMAVLDGHDIVYVARVPTTRIMTIALALGSRLPAFATSMGRVLLAGLPRPDFDRYLSEVELKPLTSRTVDTTRQLGEIIDQTRRKGWCLVDQELEDGVRSIAAPIVNSQGRVLAALNVSCHASRSTVDQMIDDYLPKLLDATAVITKRAGSLVRT